MLTDHRDIPQHTVSCSAYKLWENLVGGCWGTGWASISMGGKQLQYASFVLIIDCYSCNLIIIAILVVIIIIITVPIIAIIIIFPSFSVLLNYLYLNPLVLPFSQMAGRCLAACPV